MIREELREKSRFEVVAADTTKIRASLGKVVRAPYSSKPLKEDPLNQQKWTPKIGQCYKVESGLIKRIPKRGQTT